MKVLIIGGGASGMMAALSAASYGAKAVLCEKNEKLGKKLYITGKGRCNVTNRCSKDECLENVLSNPKFLYSAFNAFGPDDICRFLEEQGVMLKEERGRRVFPVSDKSSDIIKAFSNALYDKKAEVLLNTKIESIDAEHGVFRKAVIKDGRAIEADALIIATGGLSYPSTGSTGDGYRFAAEIGHSITEPLPSLVPFIVKEELISDLEGLSLRNIGIEIEGYRDFGELLFTSRGVSGPVILSASAYLGRKLHSAKNGMKLFIDLKPALSIEQLDKRLLRDIDQDKNKDLINIMKGLLPGRLVPVVTDMSNVDGHKKANSVTKADRASIINTLKRFELTITGTEGFTRAVVTKGGVSVREISPSDLRSKKARNIFFAGEVLDVDAYTGGYNLQIAWSTGFLAGRSAALSEV